MCGTLNEIDRARPPLPAGPREKRNMTARRLLLKVVSLLVVLAQPLQFAPTQAAATQPVPWHPCARIRMACTHAGFLPNGAKRGRGIMLDCIRPIMTETPQRKQATKALPHIDPQTVVACRQRNPNFGKDREARKQRAG